MLKPSINSQQGFPDTYSLSYFSLGGQSSLAETLKGGGLILAHTLRGHIHQGREGIAVGAGALAYIVIVLSKQCVQEITRLGYNPREPVPSYQHSPSRNQFSSFPKQQYLSGMECSNT